MFLLNGDYKRTLWIDSIHAATAVVDSARYSATDTHLRSAGAYRGVPDAHEDGDGLATIKPTPI